MQEARPQPDANSGRFPRARWVFIAIIAIAGYFLITEHKAHLSGLLYYLPFLLLLLCPLIHVFMHRGHGGCHSGGERKHGAHQAGDKT